MRATSALALVGALSGCAGIGQPQPSDSPGINGLVIPTPTPDPDDFVDVVDNPWLPLEAGATWRYEVTDAGRSVGTPFGAEAEGVALWDCGAGEDGAPAGFWIAADQLQPTTRFHVFERTSLAPVGTFSGETVAWTDGIALHAAAAPGFPHGALFAVHDDRAVAAFDLGDVARALGLGGACLR